MFEILESWFANVKISSKSHEKVDFRFGLSIERYAQIQSFIAWKYTYEHNIWGSVHRLKILGQKELWNCFYSHLKIAVYNKNTLVCPI